MIEAMAASNAGNPQAAGYIKEKLAKEELFGQVPHGEMGPVVECDRCLSAFRINAGGVYLETLLDCDRPKGASGERYDYQLTLDFSKL